MRKVTVYCDGCGKEMPARTDGRLPIRELKMETNCHRIGSEFLDHNVVDLCEECAHVIDGYDLRGMVQDVMKHKK